MRALAPREVEVLTNAAMDIRATPEFRDRTLADRKRLAHWGYVTLWEDAKYWYCDITPRGLLALRCHAALTNGTVNAH